MTPVLMMNSRGYIFSAPPKLVKRIARRLDEHDPDLADEFFEAVSDADPDEDCINVHVPGTPDPTYYVFRSILDTMDVHYEQR